MIGLGDPPLPAPEIRNPSHDELHLRDGSVRTGPFVSLDARRVITPERTFERREVRWIYLAPPPAGFAGGGSRAGGSGGGGSGDGTCGFWLGTVGRHGVLRHSNTGSRGISLVRTVRTVYTIRLRESLRSGDLGLDLDDATVAREPPGGGVGHSRRQQDRGGGDESDRRRDRRTAFLSWGDRHARPPTGSMSARPSTGIPRPPAGRARPPTHNQELFKAISSGHRSGPGAATPPGRLRADDEGRVRGDP